MTMSHQSFLMQVLVPYGRCIVHSVPCTGGQRIFVDGCHPVGRSPFGAFLVKCWWQIVWIEIWQRVAESFCSQMVEKHISDCFPVMFIKMTGILPRQWPVLAASQPAGSRSLLRHFSRVHQSAWWGFQRWSLPHHQRGTWAVTKSNLKHGASFVQVGSLQHHSSFWVSASFGNSFLLVAVLRVLAFSLGK